jgi:hypothetical protein
MCIPATIAPEFGEWLDRVRATYEAVTYTCSYRLADPDLGARVGFGVVAGLIAAPGVFRHFGLPYSGRIAHLAEPLIAAARAGTLAVPGSWPQLWSRLIAIPEAHRAVLVLACLRGYDDDHLAAVLGCPTSSATTRRADTLAYMRALATTGVPSR